MILDSINKNLNQILQIVNFMRIQTSIKKNETNMTVAKRKPQNILHKILSGKSKINILILAALKVCSCIHRSFVLVFLS